MGFWQKIFGTDSKNRQIIKEPDKEIIQATENDLMIRENHRNREKDKIPNNKDSP